MYDTILVATDGSGSPNRAVTHALDHAEQYGAVLHAITVVDTAVADEPALSSAELVTNELEDWAHRELEAVVERGAPLGLEVTTVCCHGRPHTEIVEYADEIAADLVVLGYHGQSHASPEHIGSVTDRVVQNLGRPVLVV